MATVGFTVDGQRVSVAADPAMPLLYALRDERSATTSGRTIPTSAAASPGAAPAPSAWTASRSARASCRCRWPGARR
jgi:hypothetical protein